MNNEELKKKIEGILQEEIEYVVVCGSSVKNVCIEHIADALIAAWIGDVKEAEHRAEVAEKALKHAVNVYIAHTETFSKKKWWYKYFLREAEKELAEEGEE